MRGRIGLLFLFFAVCLLLLDGCAAGSNAAFPTAQQIMSKGGAELADTATLQKGRRIFASRCTECHVARRIDKYSVAEWHHFIGMMAPRAGLKPAERAALESYIITARQSLPSG
jgi:mono/diheme cytochrome c family protein